MPYVLPNPTDTRSIPLPKRDKELDRLFGDITQTPLEVAAVHTVAGSHGIGDATTWTGSEAALDRREERRLREAGSPDAESGITPPPAAKRLHRTWVIYGLFVLLCGIAWWNAHPAWAHNYLQVAIASSLLSLLFWRVASSGMRQSIFEHASSITDVAFFLFLIAGLAIIFKYRSAIPDGSLPAYTAVAAVPWFAARYSVGTWMSTKKPQKGTR